MAALRFLEMSAVDVEGQHERQRIVALEFEELAARFRRPHTPVQRFRPSRIIPS